MILPIAMFAFFLIMLPLGMLPVIITGYVNINRKNKIIVCALCALLFGIAGYWFINPTTNPDIVRYFEFLDLYKEKNLFESFNLVYDNLYAVDIYFYIISHLGNQQLLPATTSFLFYFILFYIASDYKIRMNINNKDFIIFVIFMINSINFCSVINGIRWPLMSIIFILALYREIIQNKKDVFTWTLYIISLLFHFSTLVFVAIRLVLFIKNKKVIVLIGISTAFIPHIVGPISLFLTSLNSSLSFVKQIVYFFDRANMYFEWKDGGWADIVKKSRYYQTEAKFYYLIVLIFAVIFYLLYSNRQESKQNNMWKKEEIFTFYLMVITVISFTMSAHTYIRFVTPLIVIFCIIRFEYVKECKGQLYNMLINLVLLFFSLIGCFLNLYLLSSMIDLPEYFQNIFTTGVLNRILSIFG